MWKHTSRRDLLLVALAVAWSYPGLDGQRTADAAEPKVQANTLTGIVRDFRPDHPDFDPDPSAGWGHVMWNVAPTLGPDDKPVYVGGGYKVKYQARDAAGRPICWTLYDPDQGDKPAIPEKKDGGAVTSPKTFDQWFRDVLGVNMSAAARVKGNLVTEPTDPYFGMYLYNVPQFYPIDGRLYGNDSDHNNFFTFELVAYFTYHEADDLQLLIKSEDDVWTFIDRKLVADLGGMNGSPEQWIDLARLGLEDGKTYPIHVFVTNRSGNARLHIVTNVEMETYLPTVSAQYD